MNILSLWGIVIVVDLSWLLTVIEYTFSMEHRVWVYDWHLNFLVHSLSSLSSLLLSISFLQSVWAQCFQYHWRITNCTEQPESWIDRIFMEMLNQIRILYVHYQSRESLEYITILDYWYVKLWFSVVSFFFYVSFFIISLGNINPSGILVLIYFKVSFLNRRTSSSV